MGCRMPLRLPAAERMLELMADRVRSRSERVVRFEAIVGVDGLRLSEVSLRMQRQSRDKAGWPRFGVYGGGYRCQVDCREPRREGGSWGGAENNKTRDVAGATATPYTFHCLPFLASAAFTLTHYASTANWQRISYGADRLD